MTQQVTQKRLSIIQLKKAGFIKRIGLDKIGHLEVIRK